MDVPIFYKEWSDYPRYKLYSEVKILYVSAYEANGNVEGIFELDIDKPPPPCDSFPTLFASHKTAGDIELHLRPN